MVTTTKRKPGKVSAAEVRNFQRRYGIKVDGKFGSQSMGQLLQLELAHDMLASKPEPKPAVNVSVGGGLVAILAVFAAWAAGLFEWLGSFLG